VRPLVEPGHAFRFVADVRRYATGAACVPVVMRHPTSVSSLDHSGENLSTRVPRSVSNRMSAPRLGLAALLLFTALAAPSTSAQAQLTVDALEVFVSAPGDDEAVRTVRVRNDGTERIQAEVTTEDWERDETGTNRFLPLGSHTNSCRDAIRVFPGTVALEPGESATLRVGIAAGTSDCWAVVFLAHRTTTGSAGRQLSYTVRTGVKVYVEPVPAVRDGAIESMQVRDSANGVLDVAFRNAGRVQLAVQGTVEVRRADDSVAWSEPVPAFPVLPGARRRLAMAMPALPPGRYVVLALLDFGGAELIAGQLDYEVR
jgi:P pilus assembly chaperone PapD